MSLVRFLRQNILVFIEEAKKKRGSEKKKIQTIFIILNSIQAFLLK